MEHFYILLGINNTIMLKIPQIEQQRFLCIHRTPSTWPNWKHTKAITSGAMCLCWQRPSIPHSLSSGNPLLFVEDMEDTDHVLHHSCHWWTMYVFVST